MAKNGAFPFAIILGLPSIRLLKKPSFILSTLVLFGLLAPPVQISVASKPNKANSFDKIMAAIAIFALVGFLVALWKIVG